MPNDPQSTSLRAQPLPAPTMETSTGTPRLSSEGPARLSDRATRPNDTIIRVGDMLIGGNNFTVIAGPVFVESSAQIEESARAAHDGGAHVLRGNLFSGSADAADFAGVGLQGLDWLVAAGKMYGLPVMTEVTAPEQVRAVAEKADLLMVGARNMQNFSLLAEVAKVDRPVILKRGLSSTIEEWLASAEFVISHGNGQVILCERGIRTFESATRNTLDLSAVVVLRERTHLPVLVDPSQGTGKSSHVLPMAMAARACGAQGVMISVHPDPTAALVGGDQSLDPSGFAALVASLARVGR